MVGLWTTQNGTLNVTAINPDGTITVQIDDLDGVTATGQAVLTAADVAALQQIVAPGSTILSAAATAAIAALTGSSTAANIVAALQAE